MILTGRRLIERCLCGSDGPFREFVAPTGLTVAACERCLVIHQVTSATREEVEQQYLGAYHASADRHPGCVPYAARYGHDLQIAEKRWARYQLMLDGQLEVPGFSALDVGAANGAFVDYLRGQGHLALGIDPDPAMCRDAVQHGTVLDVQSGPFSLVTYHDVLEHLVDPATELDNARGRIREGGVIIIDVPDVFDPAGAHHYKAEHVWFFSEPALADLMHVTRFRPWFFDRPVRGKIVAYGVAA